MNHIDEIEKILYSYNMIIHIVTIEELDNLKTSRDVSKAKKAKKAIKFIESHEKMFNFYINKVIDRSLQESNMLDGNYNQNDDTIVTCALYNSAKLSTDDLNLKIKAKIIGVEVVDLFSSERIYVGYREFRFTTDEFNEFYENRESYFPDFSINEYILIYAKDTGEVLGEFRYDGKDLVRLVLPSSKTIKAENVLQRCALDMLNNDDISICAVLGGYGSGKSFLSMRMALNSISRKGSQSKVLGVREPIGEGKEIGFLKGDYEDKTAMFFTPLVQSLEGGEFELQQMIDNGQFESQIPYFLKGTTYNSTVIVCDEAEDLSEKQIRLIGTRLGKESRIFFAGDYKQGVFDATTANPLVKMCQELKGNPKFACIFLDEDVRSEASRIFANLYK